MPKKFCDVPVGTPFVDFDSVVGASRGNPGFLSVYVKMNDRVARPLSEDGRIENGDGVYRYLNPNMEITVLMMIAGTRETGELTVSDIRRRGPKVSILLKDPQT